MTAKANSARSSIAQKATSSVKWSSLTELVSRVTSPIVAVILARLLTPQDFGVLGTAMIVISFAQMFWDAGLSKALIQMNGDRSAAANVVFWTNFFLGLTIYFLLYVTAPLISDLFKSPESSLVLRVLGLQILIASLSSVQQALFVRDLDFLRLFWIKLLTAAIPAIFSIPLALYGYGVWALVAGALFGQTLNLILLWFYSPWRPNFSYDRDQAKSLSIFSAWVLGEALVSWLFNWGDSLIVVHYFGIEELGVYRLGLSMVNMTYGMLLNPFLVVLYPYFSRLQDNQGEMLRLFAKTNKVVMGVAVPMGIGLVGTGPEIALFVFGEKWAGLGFVIGLLGFRSALAWMVAINPELFRASGHPDINAKITLFAIVLNLPIYLWTASYGLHIFLFGYLSTVFIGIFLQVLATSQTYNLSPLYIWQQGKLVFISSCFMGLCLTATKWNLLRLVPDLWSSAMLALLVTIGAMSYILAIFFLDRPFVTQTFALMRRVTLT